MTKVIVTGVLIVLLMAFLGIYKKLNLLYYEESKADNYTDYISIPFFIYLLIDLFVNRYKYSVKDNKVLDATKHSLTGIAGIAILYWAIIRPVI